MIRIPISNALKEKAFTYVPQSFNIRLDASERSLGTADVYELLSDLLAAEKEHFVVFHLNQALTVLTREVVYVGTVNEVVLRIGELFRSAIVSNATVLILAHNHPSGRLKPSKNDIVVTRQMKKAGKLLDIQVIDHLIFSEEGYYSFADQGLL